MCTRVGIGPGLGGTVLQEQVIGVSQIQGRDRHIPETLQHSLSCSSLGAECPGSGPGNGHMEMRKTQLCGPCPCKVCRVTDYKPTPRAIPEVPGIGAKRRELQMLFFKNFYPKIFFKEWK